MSITQRQELVLATLKKDKNMSYEKLLQVTKLNDQELQYDLKVLLDYKLIGKDEDKYYYNGEKYYIFFEKIIKNYPVSNVMSVPVVVDETTSIYDAVVIIFLENVGTLYVSNDGYLAGVASRKDIIRALIGNIDPYNTPISLYMTRMPNIVFAHPSDSIYDTAKKIYDHQVDSIPVVNKVGEDKYKILGRFTKTTIGNLFVRLGQNSIIEGIL